MLLHFPPGRLYIVHGIGAALRHTQKNGGPSRRLARRPNNILIRKY